jgi:ubiquinone/menaquinone biosynthesis C-methylase UbiE
MASESIIDLWNTWNVGGGPKYPNEKIVQFVFRHFSERAKRERLQVLDLGCGGGVHTVFLANEGFDCYAIDISEVGVTNTTRKLRDSGLSAEVTVASAANIPYADSMFHLIVSAGVLECLNPDEFLVAISEVVRILKPGGLALLKFTAPGDFRLSGQSVAGIRGISHDEIRAALNPHLALLKQVWIDSYITTYENQRIRQIDNLVTLARVDK